MLYFRPVRSLYAHSRFFRKYGPSLSVERIFPHFQQRTAFFGIGWFFTLFQCDLCDNEGKLAERSELQPAQKCRYRVALVTCETEMITEFMCRDPPLLGRILLHVRFEQFRDTVISFHNGTSCNFHMRSMKKRGYLFRIQPVLPGFS